MRFYLGVDLGLGVPAKLKQPAGTRPEGGSCSARLRGRPLRWILKVAQAEHQAIVERASTMGNTRSRKTKGGGASPASDSAALPTPCSAYEHVKATTMIRASIRWFCLFLVTYTARLLRGSGLLSMKKFSRPQLDALGRTAELFCSSC